MFIGSMVRLLFAAGARLGTAQRKRPHTLPSDIARAEDSQKSNFFMEHRPGSREGPGAL
jgi:hypothetical protein